MEWTDRTEKLIGKENLEKIKKTNIAVFGAGGVGGFAIEGIVRSGFLNIAIIDEDKIEKTNLNRQIATDISNIDSFKTDEIKKRAEKINPEVNIYNLNIKVTKENIENIIEEIEKNIGKLEYIIDAVDDISAKFAIIDICIKKNIKLISSMGAGFKLDILKIKYANILKTDTCKLAKKIRKELLKNIKEGKYKKEDFKNVIAIYSEEEKIDKNNGKEIASMIFVPGTFGLLASSVILKDIIK